MIRVRVPLGWGLDARKIYGGGSLGLSKTEADPEGREGAGKTSEEKEKVPILGENFVFKKNAPFKQRKIYKGDTQPEGPGPGVSKGMDGMLLLCFSALGKERGRGEKTPRGETKRRIRGGKEERGQST